MLRQMQQRLAAPAQTAFALVLIGTLVGPPARAQSPDGFFGDGPKVYAHIALGGSLTSFGSEDLDAVVEPIGLWVEPTSFDRAVLMRAGVGALFQIERRWADYGFDFVNQEFDPSSGGVRTNARVDMDLQWREWSAKVNVLFPVLPRSTPLPFAVFIVVGRAGVTYGDREREALQLEGNATTLGMEAALLNRWGSISFGIKWASVGFDKINFFDTELRGQDFPADFGGNLLVFELGAGFGFGL